MNLETVNQCRLCRHELANDTEHGSVTFRCQSTLWIPCSGFIGFLCGCFCSWPLSTHVYEWYTYDQHMMFEDIWWEQISKQQTRVPAYFCVIGRLLLFTSPLPISLHQCWYDTLTLSTTRSPCRQIRQVIMT